MEKVLYESLIERQIKTWENRVFFPNEKFKEDTKADLNKLKNFLMKSQDSFAIISSETESCVYKIGRFMIENGITNNVITFQDGEIFESYIDPNSRYDWQARQLCDQLFDNIGSKVRNKWLLVPDLNNNWNKKLAIYFITKLKQYGCYGLVFYSHKNVSDSLAQILCEETYENILQFPKVRYTNKKARKQLEEDEY